MILMFLMSMRTKPICILIQRLIVLSPSSMVAMLGKQVVSAKNFPYLVWKVLDIIEACLSKYKFRRRIMFAGAEQICFE